MKKHDKLTLGDVSMESQNKSKKLQLTNSINISILPFRKDKHIQQIYHLEKVDSGNHLYLVEFEGKEMKKLSTSHLMKFHRE